MSRKQTGPSVKTIPAGDNRTRLVCPDCGYIEYANPKIVVGAVCTWENKVLLCRRAIEPQRGLWTIPAGFMELGESTSEGAVREVWEEACAHVRIEALVGVYEIPRISQVQMIYRATMVEPAYAPGVESLDVDLFAWADIPWDTLAFPSVAWALKAVQGGTAPLFHMVPVEP